jgi:hypothetical protein
MTLDRRLLGGVLGLALLVAACGSSSATATPAATPEASQPAPTEAPTSAPADSSAPSMPDISLMPGNAGDLEAMLPSSVGGLTFTKTSMDGSKIPGAGTPIDTAQLDPIFSKYGKTLADVRFAVATSAGSPPVMLYALQLKGVQATEFLDATGIDTSTMASSTIGGKSVYEEGAAGFSTIVYPKDDILFMILFASDTQAQAILAALP